MSMWFRLTGDERLKSCATDGCGGQPTWRLEADGVGSNYCSGCKTRIMTAGTTRKIKCPTCGAAPGKACRSIKGGKPLADDHTARRLISINQAVRLGCPRLRKPIWANPLDHLKIDIIDGKLGPWIHLYAPFNKECNGRDPVDMLAFDYQASFDTPEFAIYDGPLSTSDEYRSAVAGFDGVLAKSGMER